MKTAPFIALYVARVTGDRGHLEEEELGNEYIHIANVCKPLGGNAKVC